MGQDDLLRSMSRCLSVAQPVTSTDVVQRSKKGIEDSPRVQASGIKKQKQGVIEQSLSPTLPAS